MQSGHKFSIKVLSGERSSTITRPTYDVNCGLCERRYEYIELSDFSWIKHRIELSLDVLTTFKSTFSGQRWSNLDFIFDNITGFAKTKRGHIHICFKINDLRVYLDCYRMGNVLRAIRLNRC